MRYIGKQGHVSCFFCVPTVLAAGHEATRARDAQVCLRLSRAEGSWFSPQPTAALGVKEAVIESLLTLKAETTAACFTFLFLTALPTGPYEIAQQ